MFFPTHIINLVNNRRRELFGSEKVHMIASLYGSKKAEECFLAFESKSKWSDDKGPQHVMAFAHPPAVRALRSKQLKLHFDGTFKMTPAGFEQVCILGMRDETSDKHLPVFYVLMTTRTQRAYETLFEQIKHCVGEFCTEKIFYKIDLWGWI
jgi:uncharacterized protein (DUF2461 family)